MRLKQNVLLKLVLFALTSVFATAAFAGAEDERRCAWNGTTIASRAIVTAYQSSSGSSCVSQQRECRDGTLSGSYAYASCTVSGGTGSASCTFTGSTVASGSSVTAYQASSVPYGSSCVSQTRTCSNGVLSGSYTKSSCVVAAPTPTPTPTPAPTPTPVPNYASCSSTFNGPTTAHGSMVTAFKELTAEYGLSCVPETRVCTNGTYSGMYFNPSCTVATTPASTSLAGKCVFGGEIYQDYNIAYAYRVGSVPYGSVCGSTGNMEMRTCRSGVMSGTYKYADCFVEDAPVPTPGPGACSWHGLSVPNGSKVTGYKSDLQLRAGTNPVCISEQRTCTSGVLSGTYTYALCELYSAPPAASTCKFNGKTIASGGSVNAFKSSLAAAGSACVHEYRTCSNGVLSGSLPYSHCVVAQPSTIPAPEPLTTTAIPATVHPEGNILSTWYTKSDVTLPLAAGKYRKTGNVVMVTPEKYASWDGLSINQALFTLSAYEADEAIVDCRSKGQEAVYDKPNIVRTRNINGWGAGQWYFTASVDYTCAATGKKYFLQSNKLAWIKNAEVADIGKTVVAQVCLTEVAGTTQTIQLAAFNEAKLGMNWTMTIPAGSRCANYNILLRTAGNTYAHAKLNGYAAMLQFDPGLVPDGF